MVLELEMPVHSRVAVLDQLAERDHLHGLDGLEVEGARLARPAFAVVLEDVDDAGVVCGVDREPAGVSGFSDQEADGGVADHSVGVTFDPEVAVPDGFDHEDQPVLLQVARPGFGLEVADQGEVGREDRHVWTRVIVEHGVLLSPFELMLGYRQLHIIA